MDQEEIINKIHDESSGFRVTGISMQYQTMCKREAWFYLNGVTVDQNNVHIKHGSSIDEHTYKNSETVIIDGLISPDILENGKVLEVKKSSNSKKGARKQLLYYLWYLERFKDEERDGVLAIPKEKKRIPITLTDTERVEIKNSIEELWEIWNSEEPPELDKKSICDSCAYQDFCW